MADHRDIDDNTEPTENADPIENADKNDPTEPIERAEPIEPMDRTEPLDPIDKTESSDHKDHRGLESGARVMAPSSCTNGVVQAVVLVDDLDAAARRLESIGLTVSDGGRHPGRGTANRIVAFAGQYLELLAVVDESEAAASPHGRPVMAAWARHGPGLARWSLQPRDLEATARHVGHPVESRHRVLPDGTTIRWRCVAVDAAWDEPWRCAFMVWDDPDHHPGRPGTVHRNGATGFARLEVHVPDRGQLLAWLGDDVPEELTISLGAEAGPRALFLASPEGEIPII